MYLKEPLWLCSSLHSKHQTLAVIPMCFAPEGFCNSKKKKRTAPMLKYKADFVSTTGESLLFMENSLVIPPLPALTGRS